MARRKKYNGRRKSNGSGSGLFGTGISFGWLVVLIIFLVLVFAFKNL